MLGYSPMLGATDSNPPEVQADIAQVAAAAAKWNDAISTLDYAVPHVAELANAIAQLNAQGKWSGRMDSAVEKWAQSVQGLLDNVAKALSLSPPALSAIDTMMAASAGTTAVKQGQWKEFLSDLQSPVNLSSQLSQGLGYWQLVGSVARVITNPATWRGAAQLLAKLAPYVTAIVVGQQVEAVSDNVASTLGTGAKQVKENGKILDTCIAALQAATTPEERATAERLCSSALPSTNYVGWVVLGGLAAGLGYLCWQNKDRIKVQSPVRLAGFSQRKRRRRT